MLSCPFSYKFTFCDQFSVTREQLLLFDINKFFREFVTQRSNTSKFLKLRLCHSGARFVQLEQVPYTRARLDAKQLA